jgi:ribonuclease Z
LAIRTKHSTAKQAARIAKSAHVKQLLLGHFSSRYKNLELFGSEAAEVFPNVAIAHDGMSIDF